MSHPILVLRFAFSSIKYSLVDVDSRAEIVHGKAHGIGETVGEIVHTQDGHSYQAEKPLPGNDEALAAIVAMIQAHSPTTEIAAVAHRVVHGGDLFTGATLIDDDVIAAIERFAPLAPEHNPCAAGGIRAAQRMFADVPHVAVFDTAFFTDLPPAVSTYALPAELTQRLHIRKYGFHGTTHAYVSERVSLLLGHDDLRQIVCYLGKGSSVSAVSAGRPVEVSTGFTTVEGLPMRSRCGSIDPGIHHYVMSQTGMGIAEFDRILNESSGLYGLTGLTDMRKIWAALDAGDANAKLAIDLCVHRIVSYISAYHGILGGAQAISFTGAVGENDVRLRQAVCDRLECLGVRLDPETNARTHGDTRSRIISTALSEVAVLMVQQKDSLAMARQTAALLGWH